MKYMLLIYSDEKILSETDRESCYQKSRALAQDLFENGKLLSAKPLHSTTTATSVRVREGKRLITDGPFAETKEQLGGYFMVEADDLDEAICIAERIPGAAWGTVEVRPIVELTGVPESKQ
jgi:hypothetical protein